MRQLKNTEIEIELTTKCAYNCTICPREKMTRNVGGMSMELYKKIIDEGVQRGLKNLTLCGFGEPLLDKYFIERLKYAKKKKLYVTTDTTGYLLKESLAEELIKSRLDNIRISIFSTTKDIYYKLHKLDTFDLVLKRVNELIELKKKLNSKYPKIGVYFVEDKLNKHQIEDFKKYWLKRVDEVNIWKAHNWINSYEFRKKNFKRKKTCGRPENGAIQVRWDGKVSACCFDFNSELIIGDLSKQTFDELHESNENQTLIDAHKKGDMSKYSMCDNCDQMYEVPDTLIFSNVKNNKIGSSGSTYVQFEKPKNT